MGVPKGKTSKSKVGSRRSHHSAKTRQGVKCDNCGELKLPHNVCPACGYYDKKQVIEAEEL